MPPTGPSLRTGARVVPQPDGASGRARPDGGRAQRPARQVRWRIYRGRRSRSPPGFESGAGSEPVEGRALSLSKGRRRSWHFHDGPGFPERGTQSFSAPETGGLPDRPVSPLAPASAFAAPSIGDCPGPSVPPARRASASVTPATAGPPGQAQRLVGLQTPPRRHRISPADRRRQRGPNPHAPRRPGIPSRHPRPARHRPAASISSSSRAAQSRTAPTRDSTE